MGQTRASGTTTWRRLATIGVAAGLTLAAASCGSDSDDDAGGTATTAAPATSGAGEVTTTAGADDSPATGEGISLAVNPWTGSAVNANLAKIVLESQLGTAVELVDIDENATWPGLDTGDIDAVLEVWPSGHAEDYATYVEDKATVVDIGRLGPTAKIGWYLPTFVVEEHPGLATWEGFTDPELAALFATAESGDLGQFTMGDPSYVSYDEQIIANLDLPLKFVVAGSEAALITTIRQAIDDEQPVLLNFWQPHWLQSEVDLTEVELPEVTDECLASAEAGDGAYDCDYPVDEVYKAASVGLEEKNAVAFEFLSNFKLTTEQQNEIAATIDGEGMTPADAAQQWIDANPDAVAGWIG
ncbi:MAG: ABC transporter substrate-binding protein [Ilumatobacteraceae bacterium]